MLRWRRSRGGVVRLCEAPCLHFRITFWHRGPQPFQTRICTQKQDLNKVHGTQTHVQLKFQESLKNLLKKLHELGMRGVADIVINHRCGDQQDAQGRWNVFTSTGGPGPVLRVWCYLSSLFMILVLIVFWSRINFRFCIPF